MWDVCHRVSRRYIYRPEGIAVAAGGNVYVTGGYEPRRYDKPSSATLTVKYDTDGCKLWSREYGRHENLSCEPSDIVVDAAGDVYVTMDSWRPVGYGQVLVILTLKYSTDGRLLWASQWPPEENQSCCLSTSKLVAVDPTGGIYVVGTVRKQDEYSDMVTIKYDPNGERLWVANYRTSGDKAIGPTSIELTQRSGVCVLGSEQPRTRGAGYPPNDTIEAMKKTEFVVVNYDSQGEELWRAKYKGPEGQVIIPHRLAVDAKNNVYVVGSVLLDTFVIMYDSNGNQQWVRQLKTPSELVKLLSQLSKPAKRN